MFVKEQPFLQFLCEVMQYSPTGKWLSSTRRNAGRLTVEDVLKFFDPNQNRDYYRREIEFLTEQCRSTS